MIEIPAGPSTAMNRHGQDAEDQRHQDLDRHLLGHLLGPLAALDPDLGGLHAQHLADRDAEGVRLHHRADERAQVGRGWCARPSERSASDRPRPICISWSIRANSSASGPSVLRATWAQAASKPRPDSTEMVSRSMASGSARWSLLGPVVGLLVEVHVRRHVAGQRGQRRRTPRVGRKPSPMTSASTSETTRPRPKPTTLPAITRSTVQPGGLPASSSFSRMRSLASSGVSRRPMRWRAASSGKSTRSLKLGVQLALHLLRRCGQRLEHGDGAVHAGLLLGEAADGGEHQRRARRRSGRTRPAGSRSSHVHLRDLGHPEDADAEQDRPCRRPGPSRSAWCTSGCT